MLLYNSTPFLPKGVQQVLDQEYPNIEFIFIDDCSPDNSLQIVQEIAAGKENCHFYRTPHNLGTFGALRFALSKASGDYLLWACPDDGYSQNYVSETLGVLEKTGKAAAIGKVMNIWDDHRNMEDFTFDHLMVPNSMTQLIYMIVLAKNAAGKYIGYNQFIHSLMRMSAANSIFYADDSSWIHEEFFVCMLGVLGGLAYTPKCFHTNFHSTVPLSEKNATFSIIRFSSRKNIEGLLKFCIYSLKIKNIEWHKRILLIIFCFFNLWKKYLSSLWESIKTILYNYKVKLQGKAT